MSELLINGLKDEVARLYKELDDATKSANKAYRYRAALEFLNSDKYLTKSEFKHSYKDIEGTVGDYIDGVLKDE